MPAITHSDYILQKATAASTLVVVPGVWVRLLNNSTATNYYSTAVTDAQGAFTHSAVPGDYSLYYGTAATVVGTPNLVNAHYPVPVTAGDDVAAGSYTALASSPYAPNAAAGSIGSVFFFNTLKLDGVTDDGSAINTLISNANAAGGGEAEMPAGTGAVATTIVPKSNVTWRGHATLLKWTGAINSQMVANPAPAAGQNLSRFNMYDIVLDGQSVNGVDGILLNSWWRGVINGVTVQNVNGATATSAALRLEVASGTDFNNNTTGNTISHMFINNANVGISLTAQTAGSTNNFTTNNTFIDIIMVIGVKGIRFVQRCDSNYFFGITIQVAGNTANIQNVVFNDSTTPNADVGVVNIHISGIAVGGTGGANQATQSSFTFNFSGGIRAAGVWGGVGFGGGLGTFINDTNGGANAQSYYIELLSADTNATPRASLFTKGYTLQKSRQTIAYAATITPNPLAGEIITVGTLTGGITVNAPSATGTTFFAGQEMTFIFTQDGTGGRQIVWNAIYKTNIQAMNGAAAITVVRFIFDGTNWQQLIPVVADQAGNLLITGNVNVSSGTLNVGQWIQVGQQIIALADIRRSRQTPTEAVLVSGVTPSSGEIISVTLTAARVVGAPLSPVTGQNLTFNFTQGGVGAFAVTWNAAFKVTWSDAGNATGKISSITFFYNGTNWCQLGAQALYV